MKRALSVMRPSFIQATLLGAGVLLAGCRFGRPSAARYETATVSHADLLQHVAATGTLSAVVSVDVGSQVSGKIVVLNADYNSPVKKGQIVAELDPAVYDAALKQAQGNLASAQANAILKEENLKRKHLLLPLHAATQADLDQATAELDQARAAITVDEALLESAQANLSYCKITSPIDGVVIARKVDLGQTVAATFSTPVLFTIAKNLSKMNISSTVSEADIGQVRAGQQVEFTVDAFPDDTFQGLVAQVRKSPTTTSNVVTYETIITVDNPGERLFPGMTADVSILVAKRANALRISNAALRFTPPDHAQFEKLSGSGEPASSGTVPLATKSGDTLPQSRYLGHNQRIVYQVAADGVRLRPVFIKTGIADSVSTEIVDGLAEGDQVVTDTLSANKTSGGASGGGPPSSL